MDLPDDDFLKPHLDELNRVLAQERQGHGRRKDDYDWRRWLAKNMPVLMGLLTALTLATGWLGGRVMSSDAQRIEEALNSARDSDKRLDALEKQQDVFAFRLNQVAATSQQTANQMRDLLPELYMSLRADARDRGDVPAVRRLDKKLKALPEAHDVTPGNGGKP